MTRLRLVRRSPNMLGAFTAITAIHPLDALAVVFIYASTIFFVPHAAMAVGAGILVLRHGVRLQQRDILMGVFIVGALANMLFHSGQMGLDRKISSVGVPIVFLTVMAGRALPPSAISLLILLTCLEVPVGLFEFLTGRMGLTVEQDALSFQGATTTAELLYNRRVMGLSSNSSAFAEKLFIGVLLTASSDIKGRLRTIILVVLGLGLYITFNRTAILATVLFFALQLALWAKKSPKRVPLTIAVFACAAGALFLASQPLINQFTRSTGGLTSTEISRLRYAGAALADLRENPLFGNGSVKWSVLDPLFGYAQHAHNSVLMLLVENGLILGLIFIVFVAMGVSRDRMHFVFVMLIFSLTQYFFFWNISMGDIVLHHFAKGRTPSQRKGRGFEAFKRQRSASIVPSPARARLRRPDL